MTGILGALCVRPLIVANWADIISSSGGSPEGNSNVSINVPGVLKVDWVINSGTLDLTNDARILFNSEPLGTLITNGASFPVAFGDLIRFTVDPSGAESGTATFTISDGTGYVIDTFTVTVT